jgi:hypothetical protein
MAVGGQIRLDLDYGRRPCYPLLAEEELMIEIDIFQNLPWVELFSPDR